MKAHFEIEHRRPIRTADHFSELDVEDAIRRGPTCRSEYTLAVGAVHVVQIVPIRGNQVSHGVGWQAKVIVRVVTTCKLQVAV